jgi:hypothetical protein
MDYHVARNNQKLGVFAGADAQTRYQSGEILPSDLVWCEGMPAWRPASEVFTGAAATPGELPPPAIPPVSPAMTAGGPFAAAPLQPKPANYLVWAILATLLCCLPFGIVGIIFAAQVDSKYSAGDYAGAQLASGRAKLWSWLAFGVGMLGIVAYVGMMIAFGAMGALGNLPR